MALLGRGRPNRHVTAPVIYGPVGLAEYTTLQPPAVRTLNTTGSCTSASFIPPDDSTVVVLLGVQRIASGAALTLSVSDSSGGGNWTIATHAETPVGGDYAHTAIATKYFAVSPGAITVTGTRTGTVAVNFQMAVRVLAGASSSQVGAGT